MLNVSICNGNPTLAITSTESPCRKNTRSSTGPIKTKETSSWAGQIFSKCKSESQHSFTNVRGVMPIYFQQCLAPYSAYSQ